MIGRKLRDLARGLLGTYLLEQRLSEVRDAIRGMDGIGNGKVPPGIKERITVLEEGVRKLTALASGTLIRDIGMIEFLGGFPVYVFRNDDLFETKKGEEIDLPRALDLVSKRIALRRHRSPSDVIKEFWPTVPAYNYNAIHEPLLAVLHEAGLTSDFVDVGANIGDTALAAAESMETMGVAGSVHVFEPGPVFELARANLWLNRLNHRTSIHNIAASDMAGYAPMKILLGHTESGSIGGISTHYDLPLGETRFVKTVRLDEFLPGNEQSYQLKVDAEGVDFAVIRGAQGLIESGQVPIIMLEFMPKYTSVSDIETAKWLMRKYGMFNLRALDRAGLFDRFDQVEAEAFEGWIEEVTRSPHGWTDVVCIAKALLKTDPMGVFLGSYEMRQRQLGIAT